MGIRCKLFNRTIILVIPILFGLTTEVFSGFEFTNIGCTAIDQNFCKFDYCYLKSINRTYKYASAKLIVHQLPFTNISVQFNIMKRLNGYKPFLYNITFDYCKYMRSPNPGYKIVAFVHSLFKPYSNLNHTCPYTGDLIVEKVPISFANYKLTKILPVPDGNYRVAGNMLVNGIVRANAMIEFKIF